MNCPSCETQDYYLGLMGHNCINERCIHYRGSTVTAERKEKTNYKQFIDFHHRQYSGADVYKAPLPKYVCGIWRYPDKWSLEIRNSWISAPILNNEIYNLIKNKIGYPSWNGEDNCAWCNIEITEEQLQEVYEMLQNYLKEE